MVAAHRGGDLVTVDELATIPDYADHFVVVADLGGPAEAFIEARFRSEGDAVRYVKSMRRVMPWRSHTLVEVTA